MIDATKKPKNNSNNKKLNDYELYISEDHNRILNKRKQNSYAEKGPAHQSGSRIRFIS